MDIGATLDAVRVRRLGVLRGEAAALMRLLAMPAPRLARRFSLHSWCKRQRSRRARTAVNAARSARSRTATGFHG